MDEREGVHELERRRGRQRGGGLRARRLGRREADHRAHALARRVDGVADGLGLPVQLGRQRELAEVALDEGAERLRRLHRA